MSTAVAKAAPLKPEIRLAQAVSQFEAGLSPEQKAAFCAHRSEACKSPPDVHDVMRLTAEFDRLLSRQHRGGRCFGPRLTNFLQAVQQFAAIGDVLVGGSQNILACGVWSLVRMALLSIVKVSSCLEELTTFLMHVGRSAPRYERLAWLFPQSKTLRCHIYEYYIVIVGFCHKLLSVKSEPIYRQVVSFLAGLDLKTYKSEIDKWANLIREEASILKAEDNSIRLRALSKFSEAETRRQRLKANLRVLNFCSTYDYTTTWKEIRKGGTTTQFESILQYQAWKRRPGSCTLVSMGSLGSGKSVWLANIVDDLHLEVQSNRKTPVTYFFCRHDIAESLQAQTVIGSLARQLLSMVPDLSVVADVFEGAGQLATFQIIFNLLQRALPRDIAAYFVLDGLDECSDFQQRQLTQQLRVLQDAFSLRICVSFRVEASNGPILDAGHFVDHCVMEIPRKNPDIDQFIDAELERCLAVGTLTIGDATLILEIREALLGGAQGMFLWVALQIESLCIAKTDEAVRQALADLPKDLPETFSRILDRSAELGKDYQTRVFEFVVAARRPLTLEELREALSVVPGDTTWNPARLINNIYSALACCGSLISVDEESTAVRLTHHSVKQFLLYQPEDVRCLPYMTMLAADEMMGIVIATYLNYGVFANQISTKVLRRIKTETIPSKVVRSIDTERAASVRNLALSLLKSRGRSESSFDISKALLDATERLRSSDENPFRFYSYANSYWSQHVSSVDTNLPLFQALQVRLLEQKLPVLHTKDSDTRTLLLLAAQKGYEDVARQLVGGGTDLEVRSMKGKTALSLAVCHGHLRIVELLLQNGADINTQCNSGLTPISWAAYVGHKPIAKLLIENGASLEIKSGEGRTPLYWAAVKPTFLDGRGLWCSQAEVAELLADAGSDLEAKCNSNLTPLTKAALQGQIAVIEVLVNKGAKLEAKCEWGKTPLSWAAVSGVTTAVKALIEKGANIESRCKTGACPLSLAAKEGHTSVVEVLLQNGADIESRDKSLETPLSFAAGKGHRPVVEVLLQNGANVENKDQTIRTPLSHAAGSGSPAVVEILLQKGASIENKSRTGRTPLSYAAAKGNAAVVQLLLKEGADIESRDSMGETPLSWAARWRHIEVTRVLVANSANTETQSCDGSTPLMLARKGLILRERECPEEIIRLLRPRDDDLR